MRVGDLDPGMRPQVIQDQLADGTAGFNLALFDLLQGIQQIQTAGAETQAAAAAGTQGFAEFFGIDVEFVIQTLAPARSLAGTGIVPRSVQGEERHGAGVPVLLTDAVIAAHLVLQVEAVADRAGEGAGSAGLAAARGLVPQLGIAEVAFEHFVYFFGIEFYGYGLIAFLPNFFQLFGSRFQIGAQLDQLFAFFGVGGEGEFALA